MLFLSNARTCFRAVALTVAFAAPLAHADEHRAKELWQVCSMCHGQDGGGVQLYLAPSIAGLPDWYLEAQLKAEQPDYQSWMISVAYEIETRTPARPAFSWLLGKGPRPDDEASRRRASGA